MSYRIDPDATYRYGDDGLRAALLTEAQQRQFRQAIEQALDARSTAGGPGELNENRERIFVVESNDSLIEIAEENDVSYQELLALNRRDDLPDPNSIDQGDLIFLPQASPEEAAQTPRDTDGVPEGEAGFLQNLRERGNALEYAEDPSAVDHEAEISFLAADINAYIEALPVGERQEALQRLFDHDWVDAGPAQMAIEEAAEMAGIELAESAHTGPESETAARTIIAAAQAESDHGEALHVLSEGYADASPQVQSALYQSSEVMAILLDAAAWAAEPLMSELDDSESPQQLTREAMERLDGLTEGLDPEIAADVVNAMIPRLEDAQDHLLDYGGVQTGPEGMTRLMTVLDRIADTQTGQTATERLAEMGFFDMNAIRTSIAQGLDPSYGIAFAGQEGITEDFLDQHVMSGVLEFRDQVIGDQAEDYLEHIGELSYLITNGGAAMSEAQLEQAIEDYADAQGPEWEQRLEELQGQLADSGVRLLNQIQRLQEVPDELLTDDRQELINGLLDDDGARLAVSMALQERPELVRGEAGKELVTTFAELGITGADNPLAANLAGAYLRENVMVPAGDIDPSNPDSLWQARAELNAALDDNPQLAALLGVSAEDLDAVTEALVGLVPQHATDFDPSRYGIDAARNFNNALDQVDDVFRDTPFNRVFRVSALSIVGSGFANAIDAYGDNPSLRNGLQVAVESARVGVDGAQLVTSLFNPTGESRWVQGLKSGGRFVHLLGAGLAGVDALGRLSQGDYLGAGLNGVVAGGVSYAIFSSSAWAGPIGFGVATVGTLGLFAWDGIRNAQHNSRFETETTAEFLQHAGFNEAAAQALKDQSGEGYSPVPILMRYGELHGLTPEQTIEWINGFAEEEDGWKLAALRDNLHHTLDEFDGDVSRFEATADNDDIQIADIENRPHFAATGEDQPESAAQLDAILAVLEIDPPTATA